MTIRSERPDSPYRRSDTPAPPFSGRQKRKNLTERQVIRGKNANAPDRIIEVNTTRRPA